MTIDVEETGRHWPMEKLDRSAASSTTRSALAGRLGFALRDCGDRRASDANTTSGLGVPTLDGLGPIGGNDHSPAEYLEVDSIVPRTALLAALLLAVGARPGRRLAWRPATARDAERRLISSGGPWEASPATAGRSSSATRAGSPGTTDAGPDGASRASGRPRRPGAGRRSRSSSGRSARPGSPGRRRADPDVRHGRGRRSRRSLAVHGELLRRVRPAATIVVVAGAHRPDRCSSRSRPTPAGLTPTLSATAAERPAAATIATIADGATSPRKQVPAPRDERDAGDRPRATRRRRGRTAAVVRSTTITLTAASAASTAGPTSRR